MSPSPALTQTREWAWFLLKGKAGQDGGNGDAGRGKGGAEVRCRLSPTVHTCGCAGCKPENAKTPEGKPCFSFPWSSTKFLLHTESKVLRVELSWHSSIHSASLAFKEARKLQKKGCEKKCKDSWLPELLIYHHLWVWRPPSQALEGCWSSQSKAEAANVVL